jgi:solute carrier family 35 protein F5
VANSDRNLPLEPPSTAREFATTGRPLLGDFLALGSAIFYSLYITLLKLRIRDEARINMPLFFGFVGLFNIFLGAPVLGLLHVTKLELMEWPEARRAGIIIILNVGGLAAGLYQIS